MRPIRPPASLVRTHCPLGAAAAGTSRPAVANLTTLCRITIHYETHIHPLWGLDRFVDANNDGIPDLDGGGVVINNKCSSCHSPVSAANAAQVPAGDLDLTDGPSEEQALQFKSYRELLFGDRGQILNGIVGWKMNVSGVPDRPGDQRDDLRGLPQCAGADECERCRGLDPLLQ